MYINPRAYMQRLPNGLDPENLIDLGVFMQDNQDTKTNR
jgi:hypothetical protein